MFYFCKMQATGNDFVIIDYFKNKFGYSLKLLAEFFCNRHFGVGADGIIVVDKSDMADFKMRIFNSDGSEAEMCGNGIRCFAKYVYEKGLTKKDTFRIETLAGIKEVKLEIENERTVISVTVNMGIPEFDFDKIPVYYDEADEEKEIENSQDEFKKLSDNKDKDKIKSIVIKMNDSDEYEVYPVSLGNPHAVCFVDDVDKIEIEKIGKEIENAKYFPNKTNVEFVQIISPKQIKVRVWERGVGETLSCGTGACASAVIAHKIKSTESRLIVELSGGKLEIDCKNNIILKGPAEFVFEGEIKI